MTRVLRRPMFRMGGSAEGITSGLAAPRTGFKNSFFDVGTQAQLTQQWYMSPRLQEEFPTIEEYLAAMSETIETAVSGQEGTNTGISQTEDQVKKYNKIIGEVNQATGLNAPKYTLDYNQFEGPPPGHPEYNVTADFHPGGIPSFDDVATDGATDGATDVATDVATDDAQRGFRWPRSRNFNDFLISMGLDLVSRPKGGNIFQQVATSARGPFKEFQARRAAQEDRDWKREWEQEGRDIEAGRFETEVGLKEKEIGLKEEKLAESKRQHVEELQQEDRLRTLEAGGQLLVKKNIINEVWDTRIKEAKAKGDDLEAIDEMNRQRNEDIDRYVAQGEDISDQYKILNNEAATSMAIGLAEDAIIKEINPKTKTNWTEDDPGYEDLYLKLVQRYLRITSQFLRPGGATGGRVGYQNAGPVMPGQPMQAQAQPMQASMPMNQAPRPTDQGGTNEINISYEQLRDRLPPEISDNIVLLISQSYEAFADFAEIQTQADVNAFNTKYNVQLFLPKQAEA